MLNEETNTPVPAEAEAPKPKAKGRPFEPGRKKTGGRPKKSDTAGKLWEPRNIAEANKFKGLEELIKIFQTGKLPVSGPGKVAQDASPAQRVDCLKQACSYLFPRLATTELTGPGGDGPIQVEALNVHQIHASAELSAMAQKLSLALSGYGDSVRQLEAGTQDDETL
jgi:hypothetical protein